MNIVNVVEKDGREYDFSSLPKEQREEIAGKLIRISLESIGYRIKTA